MEPIFSLPYSEFETIVQLQKHFKKNDGFAILVPTSRQQKGFDLVIMNTVNSKILRTQVKSSRTYVTDQPATANGRKHKHPVYKYNLWFNNFLERYAAGDVDLYLLFGLYPIYDTKANIKSRRKFWKSIILAFSDSEMKDLLQMVRTKREQKPDRFFGFSFDSLVAIFGERGFPDSYDLTSHLLINKIPYLLNQLK